jgi:hypothetical protein
MLYVVLLVPLNRQEVTSGTFHPSASLHIQDAANIDNLRMFPVNKFRDLLLFYIDGPDEVFLNRLINGKRDVDVELDTVDVEQSRMAGRSHPATNSSQHSQRRNIGDFSTGENHSTEGANFVSLDNRFPRSKT